MITVHGLLGEPSPTLRLAAARASAVVGGARHLDALGVEPGRRVTLGALSAAVEQIAALPSDAEVLVVASGDPLYFGVVRKLRAAGLRPQVVPAVSSVAAAFAAVGLPWDDAAVVSVHGRPLTPALELARRVGKVAVLTSDAHGLPELAAGLADLERWYVLAERLGEADERVRVLTAEQALACEPLQPNVVLILERHPDAPDSSWDGIVAGPVSDRSADGAVAHLATNPAQSTDLTAPSTEPGRQAGTTGSAHPSGAGRADPSERRGPIVGQVTSGAASLARADEIDAILGAPSHRYTDGAVAGLPRAWAECDLIVSHLALGATVRILAPLLADKTTDPGVVVVDEAGRFVVPLVGGHSGGANALATRLADGLGATAVLTTATDSLGIPALDTLGWAWGGDVAEVTRAILDGAPVQLVKARPWPLPPLPGNVVPDQGSAQSPNPDHPSPQPPTPISPGSASRATEPPADPTPPVARVVVTDLSAVPRPIPTVVLRPPSLVAGMGCNRGTDATALRSLLTTTLSDAGLALESLAVVVSVDAKATEPGLIALADDLGVPFRTFPAFDLAGYEVPNPSEHARHAVGTPSVSEAAVLAIGAELIVPKQRTPQATCAIGRIPAQGRLSVVGLGPGSRDLTTERAREAIRNAAVVVGYRPYVEQITDLIRPGTAVHASGMGTEEQRTALAIEQARLGKSVALVCSGDPAIYAMASPTLEQGTEGIDVVIVPGVTASLAASALLGAPLGHDHATISLSDLHTGWATIESRLRAAAEADLVTVLYNPRSRTRRTHLPRALEIFAAHRPPTTPVAVVKEADRPGQQITTATIADFDPTWVDMNSLVVIGSSTTRYVPTGRGATAMVTPRDYHWMNR